MFRFSNKGRVRRARSSRKRRFTGRRRRFTPRARSTPAFRRRPNRRRRFNTRGVEVKTIQIVFRHVVGIGKAYGLTFQPFGITAGIVPGTDSIDRIGEEIRVLGFTYHRSPNTVQLDSAMVVPTVRCRHLVWIEHNNRVQTDATMFLAGVSSIKAYAFPQPVFNKDFAAERKLLLNKIEEYYVPKTAVELRASALVVGGRFRQERGIHKRFRFRGKGLKVRYNLHPRGTNNQIVTMEPLTDKASPTTGFYPWTTIKLYFTDS